MGGDTRHFHNIPIEEGMHTLLGIHYRHQHVYTLIRTLCTAALYLSLGVSYCSIQLSVPLLSLIVGGEVYDGLFSSCVARHHHVPLLTGEKWVGFRCRGNRLHNS